LQPSHRVALQIEELKKLKEKLKAKGRPDSGDADPVPEVSTDSRKSIEIPAISHIASQL
jgi:hypothetical protein